MASAISEPDDVSAAVYCALFGDLVAGGQAAVPSVQATIWRAIDRLHKKRGADEQISLLGDIALELHGLRHGQGSAPQRARSRLAELSRAWLSHAPLTQ